MRPRRQPRHCHRFRNPRLCSLLQARKRFHRLLLRLIVTLKTSLKGVHSPQCVNDFTPLLTLRFTGLPQECEADHTMSNTCHGLQMFFCHTFLCRKFRLCFGNFASVAVLLCVSINGCKICSQYMYDINIFLHAEHNKSSTLMHVIKIATAICFRRNLR